VRYVLTASFQIVRTRKKLRNVLTEAIGILEDTKKAFKSKRLEMLRKKLIQVLAESG